MNRYSFAAGLALVLLAVLGLAIPPEARTDEQAGNAVSAFARDAHGVRVVRGEPTVVDGIPIATWALVHPQDGEILAVGVTFSQKLADEMPEPGDGPDGAIASLEFPRGRAGNDLSSTTWKSIPTRTGTIHRRGR